MNIIYNPCFAIFSDYQMVMFPAFEEKGEDDSFI